MKQIIILFGMFFLLAVGASAVGNVSMINASFNTLDTTPVISFNATSENGTMNCTLYFNNTAYNLSTGVDNASQINITTNATIADGNWSINITCVDNGDDNATNSSIFVVVDTTAPAFASVIPTNLTFSATGAGYQVKADFNATDATLAVDQWTMTGNTTALLSINSTTGYVNATSLPTGTQTLIIGVNDTLGNNRSRTFTIIVLSAGESQNPGSQRLTDSIGGGGGAAKKPMAIPTPAVEKVEEKVGEKFDNIIEWFKSAFTRRERKEIRAQEQAQVESQITGIGRWFREAFFEQKEEAREEGTRIGEIRGSEEKKEEFSLLKWMKKALKVEETEVESSGEEAGEPEAQATGEDAMTRFLKTLEDRIRESLNK